MLVYESISGAADKGIPIDHLARETKLPTVRMPRRVEPFAQTRCFFLVANVRVRAEPHPQAADNADIQAAD